MLNRYGSYAAGIRSAEGWTVERFTAPSGLYGASGLRIAPNGELVVVQHYGNQVSALDIDAGSVRTIVGKDGGLPAPDDLDYDSSGVMYVTQPQYDRVSVRYPDGTTKPIADVPMANGIAILRDRVFVNETVPGGRILEVFADGSPPRTITQGLMLANGHSFGPDDRLYWPEMVAGEIWRVDLDGGAPERFLGGLAMPTAVKFSPDGLLTAVCAGNGEVIQTPLDSPAAHTIASMRPGQDNLVFGPAGRLFITHFIDGGVSELVGDGEERALVDPGFLFPFALTFGTDGTLYAADGMSLRAVDSNGDVDRAGTWLEEGFPGWIRSAAAGPDGTLFLTSSSGTVVSWDPVAHKAGAVLAEGLVEVVGSAWTPRSGLVLAEAGTGRVLRVDANGAPVELTAEIDRPTGLAIYEGGCFVSDERTGSISMLDDTGGVRQLCSGFDRPQGLALTRGRLFVLDVGRQELVAVDPVGGGRTTVATGLPVGDPPGIDSPTLPGMAAIGLTGPLSAFVDVAVGPDGSLFIGADGEGAILRVRTA